MLFSEQWKVISGRIHGLAAAGQLYSDLSQANHDDPTGAYRSIAEQTAKVFQQIQELYAALDPMAPQPIREALKAFIDKRASFFTNWEAYRNIRASLTILVTLDTEISFLLSDDQELLRTKTERALAHLKRALIVDDDLSARWLKAFQESGETACERLGAVHLLLHGIYAFKVDASGGRTDLVLSDPLDVREAARAADGLVLTEWKIADASDAASKFAEARAQADIYKETSLLGLELRNVRYAVVVSTQDLPRESIPDDIEIDGVIYRHVNIAITPRPPSKIARSSSKPRRKS